MGLTCINSIPGIGETCQQAAPLTVKSGLFFTSPDFKFLTYQNFVTESQWATAIAAGQIYPVQGIIEEENQDVEDSVTDTSTGRKVFNFEGLRGRLFKVLLPLEQHKKLREYSFKNWRVFYSDYNNNVIGCSDDGTTVKGFRLNFCKIGKMKSPSADMGAVSDIQIQEANVNEFDKYGVYANPSWLVSDIQGILQVELTAGAVGSNSFTATVAYVDGSEITAAGAKKSVPVSGLVAANFQVLNGNTAVTVTATETATLGTYTIAATTLVAGYTAKVVPNTDNLYASDRKTLA
jgi:hypothetical protein